MRLRFPWALPPAAPLSSRRPPGHNSIPQCPHRVNGSCCFDEKRTPIFRRRAPNVAPPLLAGRIVPPWRRLPSRRGTAYRALQSRRTPCVVYNKTCTRMSAIGFRRGRGMGDAGQSDRRAVADAQARISHAAVAMTARAAAHLDGGTVDRIAIRSSPAVPTGACVPSRTRVPAWIAQACIHSGPIIHSGRTTLSY